MPASKPKNRGRILSPDQIRAIFERCRTRTQYLETRSRFDLVCDSLALQSTGEAKSLHQAAKKLGVNTTTLWRYQQALINSGVLSLIPRVSPGRCPLSQDPDISELEVSAISIASDHRRAKQRIIAFSHSRDCRPDLRAALHEGMEAGHTWYRRLAARIQRIIREEQTIKQGK